jgi:glucose-6-phosphate 1-dehydrogenase
MSEPTADALVLFGATGDLAKRKLFPALYQLQRRERLGVAVIGVARDSWTDESFQQHARDAIHEFVKDVDDAIVDAAAARLDLVTGNYEDIATFEMLRDTLDRLGSQHAVFYLAIPPAAFPLVVNSLKAVGLHERGRVVVEKPFGRDVASAAELNTTLHSVFPEERIFRIDHYLGKEAVEDLLIFRFANTLLEPVWNRNFVDHIEITLSETIGVEGRGSFYDSVGAMRDVVQNHLLQIVALLAMEPPVGPSAKFLQDERAKVLAAMRPMVASSVVRGQYEGYRSEPGVAPESDVETFVAATLFIDSWRWADVPWYVRAGKSLATSATEVVIQLKSPPRLLFDERGGAQPEPNLIRLRLGKNDGVTISLQAKTPGNELDSEEVDLSCDFAAALGERQEAYERLLDDALAGSARRFARFDEVTESWRIVQPALDAPNPSHLYRRGGWGPSEADRMIGSRRWHLPSS